MRKSYLYSLLGTAVVGLGIVVSLSDVSTDASTSKKNGFTSEEFLEQQKQAKINRREAGYAKPDKPDKYVQYLQMLKGEIDGKPTYAFNQAMQELKQAQSKSSALKSTKADLNWIERGPGNVGGRTRGFIVDPDDATGNTWLAGSVGGGVWKTTDAGQTWECITLDWPNLSVSCLAMAGSNSNVIFAGTGEGYYNGDAIAGNGIFKTTDKGTTWELLATTAENDIFRFVNRIIVNPSDENEVIAATNSRIYKSKDGGATWHLVAIYLNDETESNRVQDLIYHPSNFQVQFATLNGVGIIGSVDAGENWRIVKEIADGRIEIGFSELNPDLLFAMTQASDLYLSEDGGDNWQLATAEPKVEFLSGQGWYNNTLVAHPTNESELFVGGLDLHKVIIGDVVEGAGTLVYDVKDQTSEFFRYQNFNGEYLAGGAKAELESPESMRNVEVRFGPGLSQNAHRFTASVTGEGDQAVPVMLYHDYVPVPFEIWDPVSNTQLALSFLDGDDNGLFNLSDVYTEQYFIHSADYEAANANADIGLNDGVFHALMLSVNPLLVEGEEWNSEALPAVTLAFEKYELKSKTISSTQLTKWNAEIADADYAHADHHNLIVVEGVGEPFRLINCNDGGIALSDDGGVNWTSPITGYVTTQFYGIAKHPTHNVYLGGTQDNGTYVSGLNGDKLDNWVSLLGGDGFEAVWHAKDLNKFCGSMYYNDVIYTQNGGQNLYRASGIGDMRDPDLSPFITRIANAASAPDVLMVGGKSGVWCSQDFGMSWKLTEMPGETWYTGGLNLHVAISPVNSKVVWAGTVCSTSYGYAPAVSLDGGATFTTVSTPDIPAHFISKIVADPIDENTAYVLFSANGLPKLFKTTDLGQTWGELSGFGENGSSTNGFPNVATYSLLVMPNDANHMWVGTEIGLFESMDGGQNWIFADNGLPSVCIWDMKVVGQQIIVGTHGLGVWTVDMPQLPVQDVERPVIELAAKTPASGLVFRFKYEDDFDKVELLVNEEVKATFESVAPGTQNYQHTELIAESRLGIQLVGYIGETPYYSPFKTIENPQYEASVVSYGNNFNDESKDFFGNFTITDELFENGAIHSSHPYVEATETIYTLKYPIQVKENAADAIMTYRDIALVEPGEDGVDFGGAEFWDYVVVEATRDGVNWIPLSDGYDVNYVQKWSDFGSADLNSAPDASSLFENHTINLHDSFQAGDEIVIRFRLYSDAATTGWGWVIDDVSIQNVSTSIEKIDNNLSEKLLVTPNPVVDNHMTIDLCSEQSGEVEVSVFDVTGSRVFSSNYTKTGDRFTERVELLNVGTGIKVVTVRLNGKVYSQKIMIK